MMGLEPTTFCVPSRGSCGRRGTEARGAYPSIGERNPAAIARWPHGLGAPSRSPWWRGRSARTLLVRRRAPIRGA